MLQFPLLYARTQRCHILVARVTCKNLNRAHDANNASCESSGHALLAEKNVMYAIRAPQSVPTNNLLPSYAYLLMSAMTAASCLYTTASCYT
jgi:hypothetical protein